MLQEFEASLRQQKWDPPHTRGKETGWSHTVWFHLYKISTASIFIGTKVSGLEETERETETTQRDNNRTSSGVMKTLNLYGSKCTQCHICCCLWYRELNSGHPNRWSTSELYSLSYVTEFGTLKIMSSFKVGMMVRTPVTPSTWDEGGGLWDER